jgi:hypothetical protein
MANGKERKVSFNLLGYGAIALYVSILVIVAAGVYGFNLSTLATSIHNSERMREQLRTGRMVITTEDRTRCRSVKFDNETVELSAETVTECDVAIGHAPSGSFSVFHNGFVNH